MAGGRNGRLLSAGRSQVLTPHSLEFDEAWQPAAGQSYKSETQGQTKVLVRGVNVMSLHTQGHFLLYSYVRNYEMTKHINGTSREVMFSIESL